MNDEHYRRMRMHGHYNTEALQEEANYGNRVASDELAARSPERLSAILLRGLELGTFMAYPTPTEGALPPGPIPSSPDPLSEIQERVLAGITHFEIAARMAQMNTSDGNLKLAIVSKRADGSGNVGATFEFVAFVADIKALLTATTVKTSGYPDSDLPLMSDEERKEFIRRMNER